MKLSNMKTSLYTINEENNAYFVLVHVYLVTAIHDNYILYFCTSEQLECVQHVNCACSHLIIDFTVLMIVNVKELLSFSSLFSL